MTKFQDIIRAGKTSTRYLVQTKKSTIKALSKNQVSSEKESAEGAGVAFRIERLLVPIVLCAHPGLGS